MSKFQLLLRNLAYHWRGNLAVFLGVMVGTAVLTGALLVGDSLRGSLRALTLEQLGWVDEALVAGRFFREDLGRDLAAGQVSPAILVNGSASVTSSGRSRATILGVDARFWPRGAVPVDMDFWAGDNREVMLNAALAETLRTKIGDTITLTIQKADSIPRESLLGKRRTDDVLQELTVTVRQILPQDGMARFSLKPKPEAARNAFVPLAFLQSKLDMAGRVNALLVGSPRPRTDLQDYLAGDLTLADWNLSLRTPEERARDFVKYLEPRGNPKKLRRARWEGRVADELAQTADSAGDLDVGRIIDYYRRHRNYLSLESQRMFLEPAVIRAVDEIAPDKVEKCLVYLADSISDGHDDVPYAIVAGLGGTSPKLREMGYPLSDHEIALARWPGSPFDLKPTDRLTITYYVDDAQGKLAKKRDAFDLARLFPLRGAADDPDLTPQFPGITDKLDIRSWENPPFPYEPGRIKPRDEEFWKRYRTTPRAYVNLAVAQRLWGSRFGQLTSIRLPLALEADAAQAAEKFSRAVLAKLNPQAGGFVFQPVKQQGLQAGAGSQEFGWLFLGFSFFLIAAALLLVGLLFRLNMDRRGAEIGLLLAIGLRRRTVRGLLVGEGIILAAVGGLAGVAAALVYASFLLDFLSRNWPGEQPLYFLRVHANPVSLLVGYLAGLLVSLLTIVWATRVLAGISAKQLLSGETVPQIAAGNRGRWSRVVAIIAGLGGIVCLGLGFTVTGHEKQAVSFFVGGMLLLVAFLAGVWAWMAGTRHVPITGGNAALIRLGVRNSARHPVRSLLTVGLLASASFLVVAVQSFHRNAGADFYEKNAGSGGFRLLAQSDVPIFQDFNTPAGLRDLFAPRDVPKVLDQTVFYAFRVRAGDDASCLNLYQPLRPRILGVPSSLIERGGFRFKGTLAGTPDEKENPWLLLKSGGSRPPLANRPAEDEALPVFADATTAQWTLHVKLGDSVETIDDQGSRRKLRLVGLLEDSIFQSELLLSDANFKHLFPRQEGFAFFLLDTPPERAQAVKSALERAATALFVTPTAKRLESYLAVENTYLATFQALGGLGLLLGALGLAVVLLRSVWERRGELALLRALGFRRRALARLVLAENSFLLVLGLGIGTLAAALSVAPHLLGSAGQVDWLDLAGLLALVLVVGLGAAALAVAMTLRAPLLTALRRE